MKILAVSDQVDPLIYSPRVRDRFGDVDLVLSCGDLPYSYMEFITTMLGVPCLFVHGNHDCAEHTSGGCLLQEPGGWVDLDRRTVEVKGILLAGLEGSIWYRPNARYQYREREMALRAWRLLPGLLLNRMRYGRYLDILIAHAPPLGIHDSEDLAHRGFETFLRFMERFHPTYLLHGHQHVYGREVCETQYLATKVINVFPYKVIEW